METATKVPTWPELIEMEPGLKPRDHPIHPACCPVCTYDGVYAGVEETLDIGNEAMAALCRDRAAEWLGDLGYTISKRGDGVWEVYELNTSLQHCGLTRDEALRAAVFAVLRSR